jgi:hypothetical protein
MTRDIEPRISNPEPRTFQLTRRALNALPQQSLHQARNWSKADVSLVEWPPDSGQRVVIKDLRRCPLWFRRLAGRRFLRREWSILRRLEALPAAPRALYQIDADAIGIEYRPGISARHCRPELLDAPALERIEAAVEELHERGVIHGDLHGDNILLAGDGAVTFIDWATAMDCGSPPRGWRARLFAEGRDLDRRAVAKLKMLYAPESVTPQERALAQGGGSKLYRNIKKLRHLRDRIRGRGKARATA